MKNGMMTRKEMISACIDDQIARGIIKPESRERQIRARLKGGAGLPPMGWHECSSWYENVFKMA